MPGTGQEMRGLGWPSFLPSINNAYLSICSRHCPESWAFRPPQNRQWSLGQWVEGLLSW